MSQILKIICIAALLTLSRSMVAQQTQSTHPFLSSTSVKASSACSTTAAVQSPNTDDSGIEVVEPYAGSRGAKGPPASTCALCEAIASVGQRVP